MKKTYIFPDPETVYRYCSGESSSDEKDEISKLIAESEEFSQIVENMKLSMAIGQDIKMNKGIDLNAGFELVQQKISEAKQRALRHRLLRIKSLTVRYAAIISIPLLISTTIFAYLFYSNSTVTPQYAEINSMSGTIVRYELPDQSVVWLNSGSKLKFPTVFDTSKREVELEGEGYFEVKADKEHPFYVKTPKGLSVYVYGTHFNVSAYKDDNFVETVLEEGKVNVIAPGAENETVILPGEKITYSSLSKSLIKEEADVYAKTAWKSGKLIFRNESINEIVKKLSRHFNVNIELRNMSGKDLKYRATFKNETLNQILDYLSRSAAIKWESQEAEQQKDASFTDKKIILTIK